MHKLWLYWKYSRAIGRMTRLQRKAIWTQDGNPAELEQAIIMQWAVIEKLQIQLGIRKEPDLLDDC